MALRIGIGDIQTHIYEEISQEISRHDDNLIDKAILSGIAEAKSYCRKYDLPLLFGTDATDSNIEDENLDNKIKDLICWQFIKLANPNINMELFRTSYEDAIAWFTKIQMGKVDPEGWPYKPVEVSGFDPGSSVSASSNHKRRQHW